MVMRILSHIFTCISSHLFYRYLKERKKMLSTIEEYPKYIHKTFCSVFPNLRYIRK